MRYISTRGAPGSEAAGHGFQETVLTGLARDGGLLIPANIPDVSAQLESWRGLAYVDLAHEIMSRYLDDIPPNDLGDLLDRSYASFSHPLVTPLRETGDVHVLELFHGPTLAFKDVALQFLGNLFEYILDQRGERLNILAATSGDTGSAAIAGIRGRENMDIFVMFPNGKTSALQERQMTTVLDDNVHNIAIEGSFDDCQSILKGIFADLEFKDRYRLGAVNSVNWARVLAQIVYYFSAWYQLDCPPKMDVTVPTGNFGNIFAGYLARRMGLPIDRLVLATNDNDILAVFFNTGTYRRGEVRLSSSPAMDIQVASNLERYLYFLLDGSAGKVRDFMAEFERNGQARLPINTERVDDAFRSASADGEATIGAIERYYREYGYLADPHTAVGLDVAARHIRADTPMVCLATAHPAKFPEVIEAALPEAAPTHPVLEGLLELPTRSTSLSVASSAVKDFIARKVAERG